jgi:hypothetical protein
MDMIEYVQLPSGAYAAIVRSATYGDIVTTLLMVAILFLLFLLIWRQRPVRPTVVIDERDYVAGGRHHGGVGD